MRIHIFGMCALLVVLSGTVRAQAPLTFSQVVELSQQDNPAVQAQQASLQATEALITQAGATPNPHLQFQAQTDGFERLSLIGLSVGQPIELGGKRAARILAAERARSQAQIENEQVFHRLRFELRRRFLNLLLAQSQRDLARESKAIVERHLAIAEQRLAAGDLSGAEVATLRVEHERRLAREEVARAEVQQATRLLGELLVDSTPLQGGVEGDLGWRTPLPPLESLLDNELLGLKVVRAQESTQQSLVRLEQSRGVSDLSVQAGVFLERMVFPGHSISPPGAVTRIDDQGPLLQFQLQIPLPLNDDNSGNIAAARARYQQAQLESEALRRRLRAELEGRYLRLSGEQLARQRLEERARPAALEALSAVEKAYQLGFRSQLDLLIARDTYLQTSEALLQAAYAESLTVAELEQLLGFPLAAKDDPSCFD